MKKSNLLFIILAIGTIYGWDGIFKYIAFFIAVDTFYELGLIITIFCTGVAAALIVSKKMTKYIMQKKVM